MIKISGEEIVDKDSDYSVIIADGEYGEVEFDVRNEEEAKQIQHAFGGEIWRRNVYLGEWHELSHQRETAPSDEHDGSGA